MDNTMLVQIGFFLTPIYISIETQGKEAEIKPNSHSKHNKEMRYRISQKRKEVFKPNRHK